MWEDARHLFVTLNVPGSNNDTLPWSGPRLPPPAAPRPAALRGQRPLAGARVHLREVRAPGRSSSGCRPICGIRLRSSRGCTGSTPTRRSCRSSRTSCHRFGGPVLLINGDSHLYESDQPLANPSSATGLIHNTAAVAEPDPHHRPGLDECPGGVAEVDDRPAVQRLQLVERALLRRPVARAATEDKKGRVQMDAPRASGRFLAAAQRVVRGGVAANWLTVRIDLKCARRADIRLADDDREQSPRRQLTTLLAGFRSGVSRRTRGPEKRPAPAGAWRFSCSRS